MDSKVKKIVFISLIGLVVIIGILHYVTPGHMILYHDTYRRLSYFPITIGAIIYGLPGGIALAILSCLSFIPHLFMFWAQGPEAYYSELSEVIFYMAAGIVIGLISSRENKLRKKLAASYKRLHKQAIRLVKAEEQLGHSQKLSMLGHVSASLAHEIKNPLASIKGAAEILADEVPKGHVKHEFVEIMKSEISRLNNSVEEVLKYCRGQQVTKKLKLEPINNIINRVLSLVDNEIKKKQITIINNSGNENLSNKVSDFFADSTAVVQVLLNILLNAIDAVGKYGKITINHCHENGGYRIDISDNGPGIAESIKKELFEPFVTFKDGGTGLGLSITRKLLKSFGGNISLAESNAGGASFTIYLPKIKSATR
jgi:signal transduction histidine kinase